jgi:membrane-associated phospholipid phosphatase
MRTDTPSAQTAAHAAAEASLRRSAFADNRLASRLRLWGVILLGLFLVMTAVVLSKSFNGDDQSIDDALNRFALSNTGVTDVIKAATNLGEPTVALGVGMIAAIAFHLRNHRLSALFTAASVIGAYGIAYIGKLGVDRHRPVWTAAKTVVSDTGPSFPSGHATGSTALATVLIIAAVPFIASVVLRNAAVAFLVLYALFMVVSRPILGVHFPTDVVAGAFLGTGWTLVCASVLRPWRDRAQTG